MWSSTMQADIKLTDINDAKTFAEVICKQCGLCFRSPYEPSLFCFGKFVTNKLEFVDRFILPVVSIRMRSGSLGKSVVQFRQKKKFREIFCHHTKGVCSANKHKCNKRKKKRCYMAFSSQMLTEAMTLLADRKYWYDTEDNEKNKKSKKKDKKDKKSKKKGAGVHPCNWEDDEWAGYGYGAAYQNSSTNASPEITVLGKKKFINKVEKILDEDSDQQ